MSRPSVVDLVVKNDLCVGCGMCVSVCASKAISMTWSLDGFLIPALNSHCENCGNCIEVCPFSSSEDTSTMNEDQLGKIFLQESILSNPKIGRYNKIYAGFSNLHRVDSSSGGLASYFLKTLLGDGIVDFVFSVKESDDTSNFYEYTICRTKSEIDSSSKTKYFPVSMDKVFSVLSELDGKVAVVGIGCFIKAIRLAQIKDPSLKEKIPFLVGIICGGIKSKFFSEYLANYSGAKPDLFSNPQFRIKDLNSSASDYSFGCFAIDQQKHLTVKMKKLGDMWGTGLFKANACDFCDDVTTELADVSLGDAWVDPFVKDGKGTNLIISRTKLSCKILEKGKVNNEISIDEIGLELFMRSQRGSFNHRHKGLAYRLKKAKLQSFLKKRNYTSGISFDFKLVQNARMILRKKSLEYWCKDRNSIDFDRSISKYKSRLSFYTMVYHINRRLANKLKKILSLK